MFRVYLLPEWREFGIDYPTRAAAQCAAGRYRAAFPRCRYVVRPCASSAQKLHIAAFRILHLAMSEGEIECLRPSGHSAPGFPRRS
jgi:hypothetical protein